MLRELLCSAIYFYEVTDLSLTNTISVKYDLVLDEDIEESQTSQSHLAKKQKKKKHHHSEDEEDDKRTKKSKVLTSLCISFVPVYCSSNKRSQEKKKSDTELRSWCAKSHKIQQL